MADCRLRLAGYFKHHEKPVKGVDFLIEDGLGKFSGELKNYTQEVFTYTLIESFK